MKRREFARVWGKPWDYSYLLAIEQRKLKEMANYFKRSQLTVGWERQVRECELCVKLLDIVMERDKYFKAWLDANYGGKAFREGKQGTYSFNKHINIRNAHRFFPNADFNVNKPVLTNSLRVELRRRKAFHLYHKIRLYRMMTWWD